MKSVNPTTCERGQSMVVVAAVLRQAAMDIVHFGIPVDPALSVIPA